MVHPIIDQYYNRSPYHMRSAAFVHTKGLAANEKSTVPSRMSTPAAPSLLPNDLDLAQKKSMGPTIPFSMMRSRTPELSTMLPRGRTSLSVVEPAPTSYPLNNPPLIRQASSPNPPSQGNIKRKRMSLNELEHAQGGPFNTDQEPTTPEEPPRTEFGNPNKIAQFFPELTLSQ